jgi:hypothetical protein
MRIKFDVAGIPVEFHRSWLTGRAMLRIDNSVVSLQNPFDPTTHISLSLTRVWQHQVQGHEVIIEKVRPLLFAGFRPHTYRVLVDGRIVAEQRGF